MTFSETGQRIVAGLIGAGQEAPTDPAARLEWLWANPKKFGKHVTKRTRDGDIDSVADYADKTFGVLAAAHHLTVVRPVSPTMHPTAKVQIVAAGWTVLLSEEGRIVTSYPFDPDQQQFEYRHRELGDTLHDYEIPQAYRATLAQLFRLR